MGEKGQRAEENHVSKTASSLIDPSPRHFKHDSGSDLATTISSHPSQYHAGILRPHPKAAWICNSFLYIVHPVFIYLSEPFRDELNVTFFELP